MHTGPVAGPVAGGNGRRQHMTTSSGILQQFTIICNFFSPNSDNSLLCRCSIIPCVSQGFNRVHNDHPPQRKMWCIDGPITPPMIAWFLKVASSLERLEVELGSRRPGLLHPMLGMAAITAPNLQHLEIKNASARKGDGFALLSSLSLMTQMKTLMLNSLMFPDDGDVAEYQRVSRLQLLEVGLSYPEM